VDWVVRRCCACITDRPSEPSWARCVPCRAQPQVAAELTECTALERCPLHVSLHCIRRYGHDFVLSVSCQSRGNGIDVRGRSSQPFNTFFASAHRILAILLCVLSSCSCVLQSAPCHHHARSSEIPPRCREHFQVTTLFALSALSSRRCRIGSEGAGKEPEYFLWDIRK